MSSYSCDKLRKKPRVFCNVFIAFSCITIECHREGLSMSKYEILNLTSGPKKVRVVQVNVRSELGIEQNDYTDHKNYRTKLKPFKFSVVYFDSI